MTGHTQTEAGDTRDFSAEVAEFSRRLKQLRSEAGSGSGDSGALLAELETAHEELRVADEEVRTQQEELVQLARLHRTERWLHDRLVAMMPAAVLVTDGHGVVRTANAAAAGLLRVRVDRLVGKPVFSFIEPAERADVRRLLAAAVASRNGFRTTATVAPRGVEPFDMELAATVARDERTGTTRVTWVCLRGAGGPTDAASGDPLLAQCLLEVIRQSLDTADTATVLRRVAGICRRAFPVEAWVSITVGSPAEPELVASDSSIAQAVDGAQLTSGQGPCERAWEQRETVTTVDLLSDRRWPRLARALADSPVRAVIATPVTVGEGRLGALNVYAADPALVTEPMVHTTEMLGAAAGAILHETGGKAELAALAGDLQKAMESRATIEQAKGILMATHGCTADEAFRRLADLSSRTNVKVRVLSERIVADAAYASGQMAADVPRPRHR